MDACTLETICLVSPGGRPEGTGKMPGISVLDQPLQQHGQCSKVPLSEQEHMPSAARLPAREGLCRLNHLFWSLGPHSPSMQLQLHVQEVQQRPPSHDLCMAVINHQTLVTDVLAADTPGA